MGLDFVFIDTEHVPIDRHQLSWMCRAYSALGIAPVVRVPSPDPYSVCMTFDGGAEGVIIPYIESVDQVQEMIAAARLRPLKGERMKKAICDPGSLSRKESDYLENYNRNNAFIVNIESKPAMENLDAILDIDGLDAVLIGPHDLSISLGIPEAYDHPEFNAAVLEIISKARARNVGGGIHYWLNVEQQIAWAKEGANLIINSSDISAFEQTIGRQVEQMREVLGDAL